MPEPRAGTVLGGRYRLMTPLPASGPHRSWLAEQLVLGRTVRVKLVDRRAAGASQAIAALRREAEALAACVHPDVARICELGEDPQQVWLGMEYVPGSTLAEVLAAGPMAPARLLHLLRQLCAMLGDLAARGVRLQVLAPEVLVLTERGRDPDHLRLADLSAAVLDTRAASSGAPGMVRAVGELLVRGLTGRAPPRSPAPPTLDGSLPPCLEWTCRACLAADPAQRLPDLPTLDAALAACAEALTAPEGADLRLALVDGKLVRAEVPAARAGSRAAEGQGWLVPAVFAVLLLGAAVVALLDHELSAGAGPLPSAVAADATVAEGNAE